MKWTPSPPKRSSSIFKKQVPRVSDASTAVPEAASPAPSSVASIYLPSDLHYLNSSVGCANHPRIGLGDTNTMETTYNQRRNHRRKERRRQEKRKNASTLDNAATDTASRLPRTVPTATRGVPSDHLLTETWGAPSGHLFEKKQGAPSGHSQIERQSVSVDHPLPEVRNAPGGVFESLETLSQFSSFSADRGSVDWDFDISKEIAEEEQASRDVISKDEESRMAKIEPLVAHYFRCAKPEHYSDFNP